MKKLKKSLEIERFFVRIRLERNASCEPLIQDYKTFFKEKYLSEFIDLLAYDDNKQMSQRLKYWEKQLAEYKEECEREGDWRLKRILNDIKRLEGL